MIRIRHLSLVAIFASCATVVCCATAAHAQLPAVTLSALSPNGGKVGGTFEVMLSGIVDGDGVNRLLFSHPGITAKPVEQPSAIFAGKNIPVPNKFRVTIGPDVPPGVYDVRAVGTFGVSNPRAFAVDTWNEIAEPAGNQSADKAAPVELGSVVNGTAAANSSDWFKFAAKKGTRVLVDCQAHRLDSKLDGTLVLFDAGQREMARSRDVNRRDPLIDFVAPADGEYFVKLYDFTYGGGSDYFYRLAIHAGPYVDFVFPPAVKPGMKNKLAVYGRNLPGGKPADGVVVQGRPLDRIEIDLDVPADEKTDARATPTTAAASELFVDGREYRLKSSAGRTNGVLLGYASEPIVVEQEPNDDPGQQITVPCEIAGQFLRRGDLDVFTFDAKKGETLAIEVVAQRMGFKTDPIVLVQQGTLSGDGKLAWGDLKEIDDEAKNPLGPMLDAATNDAFHMFTAPADGKFRVVLRDLYGDTRGEPRLMYRLILRKPRPDFRLAAFWNSQAGAKNLNDLREFKPSGQWIRSGDVAVFTVFAARQDGFAGPIRVRCEGLPAGATAADAVIPAGQDSAALAIAVAENAAAWSGTVKFVGEAVVDGKTLSRAARAPTITAAGAQRKAAEARLSHELVIAVGGAEKFPATVLLGDGKVVETKQGAKIEIPVRVQRRGDFKEALTLAAAPLPANVKAANVVVAANAKEAKLVVEPAANAPLGEFTIYLNTQTKVNYERDKTGAEAAAKAKQDMEKALADLTTAVAEAKKAAAAAPKDKKTEADKKVAEADARQKAAAAELKAAQTAADAKQKAAAAKPINNYPLASTHVVLKIVEAPKPEAKK
jgi:hypothetical protein